MNELRFLRVINWLLLALIVAGLAWAGVWRLSGNKWERVETASMGTVAPVGTLLWVEPVKFDSLKVGDFITFHPPGQRNVTYSHRVHTINSDGTIGTKGQITSPDPWRLTSHDVVGKVAMKWKGVGWIVKAAPVLFGGGFILWLFIWRMKDERWKIPVGVVGASLVLSLAIVVYRPMIRADQLAFAPVPSGAKATYVSTGLLPIRLQAYKGGHVDLHAGHVGSVVSTVKDKQGRYGVSIHPHIPTSWWIGLILLCFIPAFWTIVFGLPSEVAPRRRVERSPKA